MTEPSQITDTDQEFTPLTADEMFDPPPARKPGRQSAADKAAQETAETRRAAYEALLKGYDDRGKQIARLTQNANFLDTSYQLLAKQHDDLYNQRTADRALTELALTVQAELAYLMPDAQIRPSYTRLLGGTFVVKFTNKYGTFKLIAGDNPALKVTPADKTRSEITVDLDSSGVPPTTVLILKGHLGLADDGQLPKRAADVLRKKAPTPPEDMFVALVEFGGNKCGNPACRMHGPFGGIDTLPPFPLNG